MDDWDYRHGDCSDLQRDIPGRVTDCSSIDMSAQRSRFDDVHVLARKGHAMSRSDWIVGTIVVMLAILFVMGIYNTPCTRNIFCLPHLPS